MSSFGPIDDTDTAGGSVREGADHTRSRAD